MSSSNPKQNNGVKKRKASTGAADQKPNIKRVKIDDQQNPAQIQKKAKPAGVTQNDKKNIETKRKIVSKFFEQYYKVKYSHISPRSR